MERRYWIRGLGLAFVAHSLHGFNLGLYTLVPVFVREGLGESKALAGFLGGLGFGIGILARPLVGRLLDGPGRRWALWVGGVISVAGAALYPSLTHVGLQMYVARVFTGVAEGMLFTAFFTYAADLVPPDRRVQGIAVFGLSGLVPMSFAPAVGEHLIDAVGFRGLFLVLLGCAVASLVLSLGLIEPTAEHKTSTLPADETTHTEGSRTALVLAGAYAAALGVGMCCAFNFVPDAAREAGVRVAWFTVSYGVTAAVVRVAGRRFPDRVGAGRIAGPALAGYGLGLLLLFIARAPLPLLIGGILAGFGHGFGFPALAAIGAERAPPGSRGMVLALLTGVMDLFIWAPAWPLGRLADIRGDYGVLFATGGAAVLVCAVFWIIRGFRAARPLPREAPAPRSRR